MEALGAAKVTWSFGTEHVDDKATQALAAGNRHPVAVPPKTSSVCAMDDNLLARMTAENHAVSPLCV
jgi:hypothetical protein